LGNKTCERAGIQFKKKKCAEATPEVTKEEKIPKKLEKKYIKSRTTLSVDFTESNETNKRSM
jgi:hypothetical protein